MQLAEASEPDDERWLELGPDEHDFLFRFLRFLVEQNLADVDLSNLDASQHRE